MDTASSHQRNDRPETLGQFISASSFLVPDWIPDGSAWLEHAPFAFWMVETHRPRCLVELGSHWGYSYMAFCQAMLHHQIAGNCHAVDTWRGDDHAGFYGEQVFAQVSDYNRAHYGSFSNLIRSTFDDALCYFADHAVDLLHIDGFHTYEAVSHDFETWLPKLSERAVVLFHDINVRERGFGVWRLWEEVSEQYPHFSFHHGHGLGVLGVGKILSPVLKNFFAVSEESALAGIIRSAYARLGSSISTAQNARTLSKDVEELAAGMNQAKTEGALFQEQAAAYSAEAKRLEAECFTHQAHYAQLEQELATRMNQAQAEMTLLREQAAAYSAETKRLEDECLTHQAHYAQREQELAARDSEVGRLTSERLHSVSKVEELTLKTHEISRQRDELSDRLQRVEQKLQESLQTIEALENDNRRLANVVSSAVDWQQRPWTTRAFHRWRPRNPEHQGSLPRKT